MTDSQVLQAIVPSELRGTRLDQVAQSLFPDYSRSQLQNWIKSGDLQVNGKTQRPKDKLYGGEVLDLTVTLAPQGEWQPQAIALDIVYEDESILVINKPAGLVVHPAAGNHDGTLLNALLHHCPGQECLPRAGIVHRLDKDTSGLMVVAKTLTAQTSLVNQLQDRSMGREYEAVAVGALTGGGKVDAPIGRHPTHRVKMAVVHGPSGKPARTHYRVVGRFPQHTHIRVKLETGRTHQIRVHMAHIRHPLVGDNLYAGGFKIPPKVSQELIEALKGFSRQALHAQTLTLIHPDTGEEVSWSVPIPEDMQALLAALKKDAKEYPR